VVRSLRAELLGWVMLPLLGAVAVDGWISHRNASAMASVVQDQLLLGSARIVAEQLHFEDGAIQQLIPPAALELFQSSEADRVYYRVTTGTGQIVSGYSELPLPAEPLQPESPFFFDTQVRGEPVRCVAYQQPVLTDHGVQMTVVQIAQTLNGHQRLTASQWTQAMVQQFVILALVTVLILFGLRQGLQPLLKLRRAVMAREPGARETLEAPQIPAELAPLVQAINEYARRLDQYVGAQRNFIQNAAHQLRTPLTLLNTQVSYALRESEPSSRAESLVAIRQTVHQSVRLVNQLLTLSAAEAHEVQDGAHRVSGLDRVVGQVLEDLSGQAQAKGIDLGFEMTGTDPVVMGHPVALREIAINLVDNAIRYTQSGGIVTSRIVVDDLKVTLTVEDNGPGIAPEHRERVFERFYRIHDRDSSGCGLGLPIVREFASRMGAQVTLLSPEHGHGLTVQVNFVRAPAPG